MAPLIVPAAGSLAALRNTGNACRVDVGSASVIDNLATMTIMFWIRPSSLANGRALHRKRTGGTGGWLIDTTDTAGNFRLFNDRVTSNLTYTTSSTPLAPAGAWKLIAVTKNQGAGAGLIVRIYRGTLLGPATEVTYSAQTDGSGAFRDESAQNLTLAGESGFGLVGDMGPVVLVNRTLTLAEIRRWQTDPLTLPAGTVGAWFLGAEGTGLVLDRSGNGNHGTITSLVPVPGVSLMVSSRIRTVALATPPTVAAAVSPQFRVMGFIG